MKQSKRTLCEIYSRVAGYLRPIDQCNDGKRQEINDRQMFKVDDDKSRSEK